MPNDFLISQMDLVLCAAIFYILHINSSVSYTKEKWIKT